MTGSLHRIIVLKPMLYKIANINFQNINFQKAFDSVSHPKLLAKLESYNIRGDLLAWITAFLQHRIQQLSQNQ